MYQRAKVRITIGEYSETRIVDVLDLQGYDLILGMPWLCHHMPVPDWRSKQLRFTDRGREIVLLPHTPHLQPVAPQIATSQSGAAQTADAVPESTPHVKLPALLTHKQLLKAIRKKQDIFLCCLKEIVPETDTAAAELNNFKVGHADDVTQAKLAKLIDEYKSLFPETLPKGLPPACI